MLQDSCSLRQAKGASRGGACFETDSDYFKNPMADQTEDSEAALWTRLTLRSRAMLTDISLHVIEKWERNLYGSKSVQRSGKILQEKAHLHLGPEQILKH